MLPGAATQRGDLHNARRAPAGRLDCGVSFVEERAWLARVKRPSGGVIGAAFAVDGEHLLTCAHVVKSAGAGGPGAFVSVEFPRLGVGCDAEVLQEAWQPASRTVGDVALLHLNDPPDGVCPVPLRSLRSLDHLAFSAYGFPEGYDDGLWTRGNLGMAVGNEWVQLEPDSARTVALGFSGTAVWSDDLKAVVGMMVAADQKTDGRVAFAIPVHVLAQDSSVVQQALPTALELDAAKAHWDASARGSRRARRAGCSRAGSGR